MRMVLVLIVLVLAVIFAVQNATPVTLNAFTWRLDASLAVIIVLCFAVGAVVAALALMPDIIRHRSNARRLKHRVAELEDTITTSSLPATTPNSAVTPTPPF